MQLDLLLDLINCTYWLKKRGAAVGVVVLDLLGNLLSLGEPVLFLPTDQGHDHSPTDLVSAHLSNEHQAADSRACLEVQPLQGQCTLTMPRPCCKDTDLPGCDAVDRVVKRHNAAGEVVGIPQPGDEELGTACNGVHRLGGRLLGQAGMD